MGSRCLRVKHERCRARAFQQGGQLSRFRLRGRWVTMAAATFFEEGPDMRVHIVVAVTAALTVLVGCGEAGARQAKSAPTRSPSVSDLGSAVPNLVNLGVVLCDYSSERRSSSSRVPSPSDTLLELLGHASFIDEAARTLRDGSDWEPIERDQAPEALRAIVPAGQILVCRTLNRTFSQNPTYAHGFVVAMRDDIHKLYFIARDMDHSIE